VLLLQGIPSAESRQDRTMTTPAKAVTVTLAGEHWLRIERALHGAAAQLHRTGNATEAKRCQHTRELIQHVITRWEVEG
jgi:hypothetical protein